MTGAVKHAENANKARAELASVKAQASEVIHGLVDLVKALYVFGNFDDLSELRIDGRLVSEIVPELIGAETAVEMLAALNGKPAALASREGLDTGNE